MAFAKVYNKEVYSMQMITKKEISFEKVSKIFKIPYILLRASNPQLNSKTIKEKSAITIPGFILSKKGYSLTNKEIDECFHLGNGNGKKAQFPKRVTDFIVDDITNYDSQKMYQNLYKLIAIYPFLKQKSIGNTVLTKPIVEIRIGTGTYKTHINAAFHGNEWITSAALMKCINKYALLLMEGNKLLLKTFDNHRLSIVPMVNPDGVDLVIHGKSAAKYYQKEVLKINNNNEDFSRWKANIRGVDLNKQFPAKWDEEVKRKPKSPHYRDYPGAIPFSEPETIAMKQLVENQHFYRVHALHTQGEEIYWGFASLEPSNAKSIAIQYANKTGYEAVQFVDNFAGFKDWFIQTYRKPGFTIELGKGTNPLPIQQFSQIFQKTWEIFYTNLTLNNEHLNS